MTAAVCCDGLVCGWCVQELVAREGVGMLRYGALDAHVHSDKAVVIIDMLWAATAHPSHMVRHLCSISHYNACNMCMMCCVAQSKLVLASYMHMSTRC